MNNIEKLKIDLVEALVELSEYYISMFGNGLCASEYTFWDELVKYMPESFDNFEDSSECDIDPFYFLDLLITEKSEFLN